MTSDLSHIGKYRVDEVLGKGAMGIVYKAYDPYIDRFVAIKTIHESLLGSEMGQEMMQRFSNEAKAVGRLTHANIVGIYDFDIEYNMPYFVMELVHGRELSSMMKDKHPFSTQDVVSLISQILDGLAYTHGFGIVHRDIKPANIFILDDAGIKIADFGIARVENSELTQMGSVLGTPSYMSPEQCLGETVDARSDLFSTAVMLYELLTGRKTFKGDMSNTIMHNVVNTAIVDPSKLNEDIPKAFDSVLRKALAKKQDQRFQTAEEFKLALQNCLRGQEVGGRKTKNTVVAAGAISVFVAAIGAGYWLANSPLDKLSSEPIVLQGSNAEGNSSTELREGIVVQPSHHEERSKPGAEDSSKVTRLLKVARAHLLVGRLVSPAGGNSFDAYQMVLEIDPYNRSAIDGLNNVANQFYDRCEALYGQGIVGETRYFVDTGLELFPAHQGLQELDKKLKALDSP